MECSKNHIMVLRKGVYGKFYGCSNYPICKETKPFNQNFITKFPDADPSHPQFGTNKALAKAAERVRLRQKKYYALRCSCGWILEDFRDHEDCDAF